MGKAQRTLDAVMTISAVGLVIMLMLSAAAIAVKVLWVDNTLDKIATERIYAEVIVQPGDTLWTIATSQMPTEDPRDAVARIRELNQLQSAQIYPGQVLTLEVTRSLQPQQLVSR
ncbi:MAG: LysM peptidoglycan-binding domain-containing protein [Firmicutes bacterium]|nr:LysM peptidoglycan-binding domain-containing protein [Bacillota bacterium]